MGLFGARLPANSVFLGRRPGLRIGPAKTPPERGRQPIYPSYTNTIVHNPANIWMSLLAYTFLKGHICLLSFFPGTSHPINSIMLHAAICPIVVGPTRTTIRFELIWRQRRLPCLSRKDILSKLLDVLI
jgi:hypothetical protein